jgi:hypothetical protein
LARSEENTCANSLPLSRPPRPIAASRAATPCSLTSRKMIIVNGACKPWLPFLARARFGADSV